MGRVSFRRNASNYCPLVSEVLEYAKHQVDKFYLDLIDELDLEEDEGDDDEDDDDDENGASSNCDETPRDRIKSRLGLNVMDKTVKFMKKSGTWDNGDNSEIDEDDRPDGMPVLRDLMLMDESGVKAAPESVDCDLASEVDRLLCIGDDPSPRLQLTPTTP